MSNDIIPADIRVPAHVAQRVGTPSALAQSMTGGIAGGVAYPRISIKGGRFRIVEGDTETVLDSTTLDVIIVGANPRLSKTWYAKAWSKDAEPTAPDCFSLDGVRPDPEATDPQNDLCASCPQNAWGSKVTPTGQEIKACSDQKRLAIVAADDPTGPIYLLQVTPAALKGLNQYQKELSVRGIPAEIVKTRISFDTDASFPKLKFGFGGFLQADDQAEVDKLFGTDEVKEITGEVLRQPAEVAKAAPPKVTQKTAPKPVEEPEPAAPAKDEEAPATPKRGFGASTSAKKKAKPAPEPKVVAADDDSASSLADEIAALVGETDDDDDS